jgi:hypothetical protein
LMERLFARAVRAAWEGVVVGGWGAWGKDIVEDRG